MFHTISTEYVILPIPMREIGLIEVKVYTEHKTEDHKNMVTELRWTIKYTKAINPALIASVSKITLSDKNVHFYFN